MRYVESINIALHQIMQADDRVVLIGEDLHDPYGGSFKASQGLSTDYPGRVISTPISEAAITGAAIGMAMRGMRPIVEIMFGDFILLTMDQIVNHASKYKWMFNNQVSVPIIIRTPMGGGRGYGPTHSQSLESLFMSVPGLSIYTPSIFNDPGKMLIDIMNNSDDPVLFIENKLSYPKKINLGDQEGDFKIKRTIEDNGCETVCLSMFPDEKDDVTIFTYGGMVEIAIEAAKQVFFEEEVLCSIIVCNSLKPIANNAIDLANNSNQIIILEEGNKTGGWGAEMSALISEKYFKSIYSPIIRIGSEDHPIPCAISLERKTIPSVEKLKKVILKSV
jgi:pyruvate/2-oxoglutarate/acetoin dehydrogenase E1 component